MKDFRLRNDTELLFRNDPVSDITVLTADKKVLFVYGGASVHKNGCFDDVKTAVSTGNGTLFELGNASREFVNVEKGLELVKQHGIEMIIGAGGASIMDCAKLIAFGAFHEADLWEYVKGRKSPYKQEKLPLILIPTYPSSGSEYGLGAVTSDERNHEYGTAYGIPADVAILVPKYSLSLNAEMTMYTGLVTLVQLSAATIGDKNSITYDAGISVIKNILKAVQKLKADPNDLDARGTILFGASISTSSRLGIGKEENYAYDIYEVEFVPEILFGATYRRSLTTLFPRFLKAMAVYHREDIQNYFYDAFGFDGTISDSVDRMVKLFEDIGVPMYFDGEVSKEAVSRAEVDSVCHRMKFMKFSVRACKPLQSKLQRK